jgi:hypothetical protein
MRVKGPSILNVGCYFELIPGRCRRLYIRIVFGNHLLVFRLQALVVSKIVLLIRRSCGSCYQHRSRIPPPSTVGYVCYVTGSYCFLTFKDGGDFGCLVWN